MEILGIAAAPVSFGVFGSGDDEFAEGRDAAALLGAMSAAGYSGTELGPPRFFGPPDRLRSLMDDHGLEIAGAYVPLHLGNPARRADDMRTMRLTLEELAVGPRSLAILADWGSEILMANPARPWGDRSLALDDNAWRTARDTLREAIDLATEFGVETSYHPHISTYVESRWEIERLMDTVDISLTIDTGHIFLAGSSPSDILRTWPARVNHIHLKDVRQAVLREAKASGRADLDAWWPDLSCPLGEGDVELDVFIESLRDVGYEGWLVVEQDRARARADEFESIARDQARSRTWILERLALGEVPGEGAAAPAGASDSN